MKTIEPDIVVLEDQTSKEMKVGACMKEVMVGYMKNMWGTNEVLSAVSAQCKVPKQAAEDLLNSHIKTRRWQGQ